MNHICLHSPAAKRLSGSVADYTPRRYTRERSPIPVLTGLDVEQLRRSAQRRYH